MKTYYSVEIRRLGLGWGTLPMGKLRGAWIHHCQYKVFTTVEEAMDALANIWFDLEADDVIGKIGDDI